MSTPILHYIHDPLCGWCYAAGPMVRAASDAGVSVVLHGGALWGSATGAGEAKRRAMRQADARIAEISGQPFGAAYLDGLLVDPKTIWWSRPTVAAILAADGISGSGLKMFEAIQHAHYVLGLRVVEESVLVELAKSVGLDENLFRQQLSLVPVDDHIQASREFMSRFHLHGFPCFVIETNGRFSPFPHETYYSRPDDFAAALRAKTAIS